MENDDTKKRKPGPLAGPKTERTTLMLDPELAKWGKQQPGGLSELVRRLLREERERLGEQS